MSRLSSADWSSSLTTADARQADEKFDAAAQRISKTFGAVKDLAITLRHLSTSLGELPEAVFLKSPDDQLLFMNDGFRYMFMPQPSTGSVLGMKSRAVIHDEVIPISKSTDQSILHGCREVRYKHQVHLQDHGLVRASSVKFALIDSDGKLKGILGMSRPQIAVRRQMPHAQAERLGETIAKLRPEHQAVLKLVCNGVSNKLISEQLGLPVRTVENQRGRLMKKLGVESTVELVKLVVRLEDAGVIDLGV